MQAIAIPANAVAYTNLEQQTGWVGDDTASIGPNPPAVARIIQATPPPILPPMTMTLSTTGIKGEYCDWMAKKVVSVPAGALNCLIRASYIFDSVEGIQAWEVGRRKTDENGVTDNGQTQLVPLRGGLLEFDVVPSANGGWIDTGIRFSTFVVGVQYDEELYYVNDANGALSLQYVSLNGTIRLIPPRLQHIAGMKLGWAPNEAVVAFQPDANPIAAPFNAQVKMNTYFW
jgi:hypothetical protein